MALLMSVEVVAVRCKSGALSKQEFELMLRPLAVEKRSGFVEWWMIEWCTRSNGWRRHAGRSNINGSGSVIRAVRSCIVTLSSGGFSAPRNGAPEQERDAKRERAPPSRTGISCHDFKVAFFSPALTWPVFSLEDAHML